MSLASISNQIRRHFVFVSSLWKKNRQRILKNNKSWRDRVSSQRQRVLLSWFLFFVFSAFFLLSILFLISISTPTKKMLLRLEIYFPVRFHSFTKWLSMAICSFETYLKWRIFFFIFFVVPIWWQQYNFILLDVHAT